MVVVAVAVLQLKRARYGEPADECGSECEAGPDASGPAADAAGAAEEDCAADGADGQLGPARRSTIVETSRVFTALVRDLPLFLFFLFFRWCLPDIEYEIALCSFSRGESGVCGRE